MPFSEYFAPRWPLGNVRELVPNLDMLKIATRWFFFHVEPFKYFQAVDVSPRCISSVQQSR